MTNRGRSPAAGSVRLSPEAPEAGLDARAGQQVAVGRGWSLTRHQRIRARLRRGVRRRLRELGNTFIASEATGLSREQLLVVQSYYRRPSFALLVVAALRLGIIRRCAISRVA